MLCPNYAGSDATFCENHIRVAVQGSMFKLFPLLGLWPKAVAAQCDFNNPGAQLRHSNLKLHAGNVSYFAIGIKICSCITVRCKSANPSISIETIASCKKMAILRVKAHGACCQAASHIFMTSVLIQASN